MNDDLSWLLDQLVHDTVGVLHALLLSDEGMKLAHDKSLDHDTADLLSAMCTTWLTVSHQMEQLFDTGGPALTATVETPKVQLLAVSAGKRAILATLAKSEADPGIVGTAMAQLVERAADHLTVQARSPRTPS
ncbi:roadblock/LC7 domain-containing protein [Streptomyces nigrescens]|uniref:roadblock/LC7 domain-containing protein n=1 Tax=Streptomyces nigrescens TaxID=1920 RepID=UPI0036FD0E9A